MKGKEAKAVSSAPRGNYMLIPNAYWDDSVVRLNQFIIKRNEITLLLTLKVKHLVR